MIHALGGVLIYTSADRFAAMRHFYVEVLGLTPRSNRPGFVNFELGEHRLTVAVHSEISDANRDSLHVMVNLLTYDIEAAYEEMVDRGAHSLRPPQAEKWGGMVATLQDPDGNVIQLIQLA